MTSKNYLLLRHLVVTGQGRRVYDQKFHVGINILRGENESGKTTITEMIFFVLGGENIEWTDQAESCDYILAEFDISGTVLTLKREISKKPSTVSVAEGSLEEAEKQTAGWSVYGRVRSERKESFSQFLFQHLGFPATKSDDSNANVTMYQVLRLLYADQHTDSTSIFRRERLQFADRQDVRKSVGEMLLGIDDFKTHEMRQEIIRITKLFSEKKSRLDSITEAATKTDPNFSVNQYSEMIANTELQQAALERRLFELSQENEDANPRPEEDEKKVKILREKVNAANSEIQRHEETIQSLELNIADSEIFINALEADLTALSSANSTREIIGHINLIYCPLCLSSLSGDDPDHCPLCRTKSGGDVLAGGRIRYSQELKHQINESKALIEDRQSKLIEVRHQLATLTRSRNRDLADLKALVEPTTRVDPRASELLKQYGYLSRLIEDLGRLEGVQKEVESLQKEVSNLRDRLATLEDALKHRQEDLDRRREYCQNRIGDLTVKIIHQDVVDHNDDSLRDATGLVFSFERDFLSVRHGRLSASTQAFLKNSFYLALLKFSVEDDDSRLPKFFILDNIEDKGMVPARFRKFHHMLVDYSKEVETPHQVIITTSYIDKELDGSEFCVGPSYDRPPYTLDLGGTWRRAAEEVTDSRRGQ